MMRTPPIGSMLLIAPPNRRALPPARMAAATGARVIVRSNDIRTAAPRGLAAGRTAQGWNDERAAHRPDPRRQPPSVDSGSAAEPDRVLRELAQQRRVARRD